MMYAACKNMANYFLCFVNPKKAPANANAFFHIFSFFIIAQINPLKIASFTQLFYRYLFVYRNTVLLIF